jgi:hypothetical protein
MKRQSPYPRSPVLMACHLGVIAAALISYVHNCLHARWGWGVIEFALIIMNVYMGLVAGSYVTPFWDRSPQSR